MNVWDPGCSVIIQSVIPGTYFSTLCLPNLWQTFSPILSKNTRILGILGQPFASQIRPVAHFSRQLDPVTAGMPSLIDKASTLPLGSPLTFRSALSQVHKTEHLSTWWQITYEQALLTNLSVIWHHCNTKSDYSTIPLDNGEPHSTSHDCLAATELSQSHERIS